MISFLRAVLIASGVFVAIGFSATSARAATEYCGARVVPHPVSSKTWSDAADVFALSFAAKSARTVSGTVMMHADNGWYAADFQNVKIEPHADRYQTPILEFTRTEFRSDYVYVRFPSAVKLLSSFVARASVSDDAVANWDGAMHDCYAYDDSQLKRDPYTNPHPYEIKLVNKPSEPELGPGATVLAAKPASPPGTSDCTDPFADATVTKAVAPPWPMGYTVSTTLTELVRVTVGPQGELDDAILYAPTGSRVFDEAGIGAARASTYKAARAFCKDVPGDYLFRVEFNPD